MVKEGGYPMAVSSASDLPIRLGHRATHVLNLVGLFSKDAGLVS